MTNYTTTVSSKGQITIPIEARRKLGLHDKVSIELKEDKLTIKQPPSMEDAWAILDAPQTGEPEKPSKREAYLSEIFSDKDRRKRGY